MNRKPFIALAACLAGISSGAPAGAPFSFDTVDAEAAGLAAAPYAKEPETNPPFFANLEYDDATKIRFRPECAFWSGSDSPWKIQFFNPARYHERITRTFAVDGGVATEIPFDPKSFDYGDLKIPPGTPYPAGFAGFHINGRTDSKKTWDDELAVFVGATYFRCVPTESDAIYGLSARAVAINTGLSGIPEEFPFFKKFWIERAAPGAKSIVVYALMDGPTVAGAFRIEITPGAAATSRVKASLHFRSRPERFGIAPFSSMFAYGENSSRKSADFRNEVHDSDGLLIADKDGRRYWRPLENEPGRGIRESVFALGAARGFGLRQRDLDSRSYADLENLYHKRPGVWILPGAGWPEGSLHLFELSSGEEDWDNIVTYWRPSRIPGPGESLKFEYTIIWALEPAFRDPLARVTDTYRAATMRLGQPDRAPGVLRYFVDFSPVPGDPAGAPEPTLATESSGGARILSAKLIRNGATGGFRAILDIRPPEASADFGLSARLMRDGHEVSEIWDARPLPRETAPTHTRHAPASPGARTEKPVGAGKK